MLLEGPDSLGENHFTDTSHSLNY